MRTTQFPPPAAEWLAALPDALPLALVVTRAADGVLLYANCRFGELLGVPTSELVGKSVRELYVDSSARRVMLDTLARDGRACDFPIELRRPDGVLIQVVASIVLTAFSDEPAALLGVLQDATERLRAEQGRDERIRMLLESTGEGILGFDETGACGFANPASARLLGWAEASELVGRGLHAVLHGGGEDSKSAASCPFCRAALAGERSHADGEPLVRRDGSSFPAECWSYPVLHDSRHAGCVVTFVDVTERRHAEALLAERSEELAQVARFPEMNPGAVVRLDLEGRVLMANRAARDVFGDGLIGRRWQALLPELGDPALWRSILESDAPVVVEAATGGCDYIFTHRRDAAANLVFAFGADVSGKKRAERELAEQTEMIARLARFPDMNPGPVLRLDCEGTILMANAAASEVFGADPVGTSWRAWLPELAGDMAWSRVLTSTGPLPIELAIGDRFFVFTHRRDTEADLVFVFGADVTAQKTAERALRQTEKMATLGTLAAGVAHELNNPAAATRRAAEQLRAAFAKLDEAHLRLGAIELTPGERETLAALDWRARESAGRAEELDALTRSDRESEVEEWLDAAGIEEAWELAPALVGQGLDVAALDRLGSALSAGALAASLAWAAATYPVYMLAHEIGEGSARISEIVRALRSYSYLGQAPVQLLDVHEGLDSTLVILRNKLKVGVEVVRRYATDLPKISAYGSELNQVWTNLIDNAADAMNSRGTIIIETRRAGDGVAVVIEDSGPGVPAEIQSRIFDPFFTTKEPGRGTGLGLSTSYGIITEKHGGKIAVESRPGRTRFTVTLPCEPPSASAQQPKSRQT